MTSGRDQAPASTTTATPWAAQDETLDGAATTTAGASTTALASVSELSPSSDRLTPRQRRVLETIRSSVEARGYPPTMREIGESVGLASPSSVKHQLTTLERKGYLRRDPNRPRAIEVVDPEAPAIDRAAPEADPATYPGAGSASGAALSMAGASGSTTSIARGRLGSRRR